MTNDDHTQLAALGAKIASIRTLRGMTQSQLAIQMSSTQSTISGWERGRNDLGVLALLQLADVLSTPPGLLLTDARKK